LKELTKVFDKCTYKTEDANPKRFFVLTKYQSFDKQKTKDVESCETKVTMLLESPGIKIQIQVQT